jgi:hypothetical protein
VAGVAWKQSRCTTLKNVAVGRNTMRQAERAGTTPARKMMFLRMAASWLALANDAAHVNGLIGGKSESDENR